MVDGQLVAEQLRTFASRLRRLTVSHSDPEAFHEHKSELIHDLERAAAEHQGSAACLSVLRDARAQGHLGFGLVDAGGVIVPHPARRPRPEPAPSPR